MKLWLILSLLIGVALATVGPAAAKTGKTSLVISVYPDGHNSTAALRTTLRCHPTGGSHPQAAKACRFLDRHPLIFRPRPKNIMCSDIYGGPQIATVTGFFHGRRVSARFDRVNGCGIDQWRALQVLLGSPQATATN